jgi:hypothetical protein
MVDRALCKGFLDLFGTFRDMVVVSHEGCSE